jgi:CRISPR-associated endoribonuclease Cas6
MKFKLSFQISGKKNILPINYQYELSAWIYKTLNSGNSEFADWLHNHGYSTGRKIFKLFAFSKIKPGKYKIVKDRMEIASGQASLYVSFFLPEAAGPFILGVFRNQSFTIGDKISRCSFVVSTIEKVKEPKWSNEMSFRADSPVVVSILGVKYAQYLEPSHKEYGNYIIQNLINKYATAITARKNYNGIVDLSHKGNISFKLMSKPVSKLITIKTGTKEETKIRGYTYNFKLKAPLELMKIGYYSGFGEKNSLGFGSVELIEQS